MFPLFDIYEERGRKAGKAEGLQEGRQEERHRGMKALVKNMRRHIVSAKEILREIHEEGVYSDITEADVLGILQELEQEEQNKKEESSDKI